MLVFYGLYSYLPQVVADNGQEIGSQLVEQFGKTRDGASNLQQAVAQLVLVLRGIYADCRQKYYFDAGQQRVEGVFCPDRSVKYGIMWA